MSDHDASVATIPLDDALPAPNGCRFPVVGIGASAGGLQAVRRLLENLPAENGMAFVVVLHLAPKYESHAPGVLQRSTSMPVTAVAESTRVETDHVYVVSSNQVLAVVDGELRVGPGDSSAGRRVDVDLFFRALADVQRERAIGIVLSGAGADGAVGLSRIKERGGVTIAQSPEDAEYDGMPASAIATGMVDLVLPVVDMPAKLVELWANARAIELPVIGSAETQQGIPPVVVDSESQEQSLREILGILRNRSGHDFRHYKRATVLRRIERRLQVNAIRDLAGYRDFLQRTPEESPALLRDMLIGVTNFFRDPDAFDAVAREIVPMIFEGKQNDDTVRAWVAACATGEEAYSIAILLRERAATMLAPPAVQVFGTDIDERAIAAARAGTYPESIATDVSPERLHQFFQHDGLRYRVNKATRDSVLFAPHNVLRDPPFSRLDFISCRNLLIYLNREVQQQVMEMFHFALRPGGYLFLGSSESVEAASRYFSPVDKKNSVFRSNVLSRSARFAAPVVLVPRNERDPATLRPPSAERAPFSFAELHQRVLEQYAPPSVVVTPEHEIVHMSAHAGRYLRHAAGEPSHNLITLVLPALRLELRTALFQATQTGKSVEARRVQLNEAGRVSYVTMLVRPIREADGSPGYALVLFDEVEETMATEAKQPREGSRDPVLEQLEAELEGTKEHLQSTLEQAETSTEELRASIEELQAINEELRSATEELETSKEELHSINEELTTVNLELNGKVEELSRANDDLLNFVAATEIATVFVDSALRVKRFTPRATEIFSLLASDVGRPLLDVTHRLDYPTLADDATAVFETLRVVEREVRSLDGKFYFARMLPYRTIENRIEGAVLTFVDISGRRRAEERLRVGQEQMRLVAESTNDYAIITLDEAGLVTSWNKGAERVFGYAASEILGLSADRIFTPEDRARGIPDDEMRRARDEGRAEDERWHLRKDGSTFYCSGVMTPLRNGGVLGFAKIARDQTGLQRMSEELEARLVRERSYRVDEQAASSLKDEFLAVMSHELKHPLNLINVNVEVLTRLPEVKCSTLATGAANAILGAVQSQAKIVDDLLDYSRLRTGKLTLEVAEVDLGALVAGVVDVVRVDSATAELSILLEKPESPVMIRADGIRVEQIVWNLVSNATKFTPAGGRILLRVTTDDAWARLDVVDTGQGIEPEFLARVFDMFGQAGRGTTRNKGGLGIGLALVRQLVDLHHGRLEVASAGAGQGTRFSAWLPRTQEPVRTPSTPPPAEESELRGLRILVVDDTSDTVEAYCLLLTLEGAKPQGATSAAAALELASKHDFDLVLSDIGMPDMDGHALITRLRAGERNAHVPAIALTGYGQPNDIRRAIASGFSAHITKPVMVQTLRDVVAKTRRAAKSAR